MGKWYFVLSFLVLSLLINVACDKEEFATGASDNITFSTDTVSFDTIFTEVGSVTKLFKIYNPNSKSIRISKAYIKGGNNTNFRISIDGLMGNTQENIEVPPKDSLFIFVEVTLDPNRGNLPLVIYDAIVFETNGNISEVTLEAFGQDVHFIRGKIIETQTWVNDKPYLIYNGVAIDSNHTLTIQEGVKVHFHSNSSMLVWGQLLVNGTLENPVVFEGDRFDRGYDQTAGRWGTVFIHPRSTGNSVNYAIIKNAQVGFQVGEPRKGNRTPSLVLNNTLVLNSSFANVLAFGAEITAYNCVFADAQYYGLALLMGGKYNFYHVTMSLIGAVNSSGTDLRYQRKSPSSAVLLTNWYRPLFILDDYFMVKEETVDKELMEANFYNSIIYGNKTLEFDFNNNENSDFNYFLDHCLLKQLEDSIDVDDSDHFRNLTLNEYPRFVNDSLSLGALDYSLDTLSPAKDSGSIDIVNAKMEFLQFDYNGNSRLEDGKPDLGAFERKE